MSLDGKHEDQKKCNAIVKFTDGTDIFLEGIGSDFSDFTDGYVQMSRGEEIYTFFTRNINYIHILMPEDEDQ